MQKTLDTYARWFFANVQLQLYRPDTLYIMHEAVREKTYSTSIITHLYDLADVAGAAGPEE